jgi:hypothetical protein
VDDTAEDAVGGEVVIDASVDVEASAVWTDVPVPDESTPDPHAKSSAPTVVANVIVASKAAGRRRRASISAPSLLILHMNHRE